MPAFAYTRSSPNANRWKRSSCASPARLKIRTRPHDGGVRAPGAGAGAPRMKAGLWRAEWLKLRRMGIVWITLLIPAALVLLGSMLPIFSLAGAARQLGAGMIQNALAEFSFPQPIFLGMQIVDFLGPILILIFVTATVGNEFSFDTWKNLIPRHPSRDDFLVVKLAYALSEAAALVVCVPLMFQAGALFALGTAL